MMTRKAFEENSGYFIKPENQPQGANICKWAISLSGSSVLITGYYKKAIGNLERNITFTTMFVGLN